MTVVALCAICMPPGVAALGARLGVPVAGGLAGGLVWATAAPIIVEATKTPVSTCRRMSHTDPG
jgi:hypothetical protein